MSAEELSTWFRIDGHVHCLAVCSPRLNSWRPSLRREKIRHVALRAFARLDGIILTDHSSTAPYDALARNEWKGKPILPSEYAVEVLGPTALRIDRREDERRLIVFKGEEIKTSHGDLLGWFIEHTIPNGLTPEKTVAEVHRQGGLAIAPHPFSVGPMSLGAKGLSSIADQIDGIQHDCTVLGRHNDRAARFAEQHGLPYLASSDAHHDFEVGISCFGVPRAEMEAASDGDAMTEAVKRAVRSHNIRLWIEPMPTIAHIVHLYLLQRPSYFLGLPLLH